jgi:hypothetical protein
MEMSVKGFAVLLMMWSLLACSRDGPAERLGEGIDEAIEDTGEAIDDAVDDVEDAVEDAGDTRRD